MRYRCKILAANLLVIAALAAIGSPAEAAVSACSSSVATLEPTQQNVRQVKSAVLCLVNRERTRRGLPRLSLDSRLSRAAAKHSRDMVRRGYFDHVSPGGRTVRHRIMSTGWLRGARGWTIGENLAWGSGRYADAADTVRSWMLSPGHRANILNAKFRQIGIGIALGTPETESGATYTTTFGARL